LAHLSPHKFLGQWIWQRGCKFLVEHAASAAAQAAMPTTPSFGQAATAVAAAAKVASTLAGPQLSVGQHVIFQHNREDIVGEVVFVGSTKFSQGNWIGIKLDTPTGKHDGSVRGETYFSCPPLHGLFIRPQNVMRVLREGESKDVISVEVPPRYASVVAALPQPETVRTPRTRFETGMSRLPTPRRASMNSLPSSVGGNNEDSGVEMRALLDALQSERAAHARCLHEQETATGMVGKLEQEVSERTNRLSALQGELQRGGIEEVAQASEHAADIAALEAAHIATRQVLVATEVEVQSLRAALEAAHHSETREVEEWQFMKAMEAEACRAAKEEIQTLAAERQRHIAELQSLQQLTSDLKEQSKSEAHVVHDEMQGARALAMSHSRELELATAAAYKAESDCFAAERLALEEELRERNRSHREREQVLGALIEGATAGRSALLSEVGAARFEIASAEMHAKTEEQTYAIQIEAATLAASTKELEALRAANKAAAELHKECRARQLLMEELANLRSLSGQQQQPARQRAQTQQGGSWFSESVMGSLCCVRQPATADVGSSLKPHETVPDISCSTTNPELTVHGPGTPT